MKTLFIKLVGKEKEATFSGYIETIINNNINVGCHRIQNDIQERALSEINKDPVLMKNLQMRREYYAQNE